MIRAAVPRRGLADVDPVGECYPPLDPPGQRERMFVGPHEAGPVTSRHRHRVVPGHALPRADGAQARRAERRRREHGSREYAVPSTSTTSSDATGCCPPAHAAYGGARPRTARTIAGITATSDPAAAKTTPSTVASGRWSRVGPCSHPVADRTQATEAAAANPPTAPTVSLGSAVRSPARTSWPINHGAAAAARTGARCQVVPGRHAASATQESRMIAVHLSAGTRGSRPASCPADRTARLLPAYHGNPPGQHAASRRDLRAVLRFSGFPPRRVGSGGGMAAGRQVADRRSELAMACRGGGG